MPICVNAHCLMLEVLRYIALNALSTVQKIKAMSKMLKIDKVHIRGVMLCMSKMSKMGKEHTHTFWLITSLILNDFQSEKSFGKLRLRAFQPYHQILCMSKHVEDVEDGKRTYTHTFIIPFLIWYHLNVILCMSKMSKIDQIHLRAVMLCMLKHVEDVEDRSNTPKGCNAMYVEDVEDGKRTYTHILAHNFLNT